MSQKDCLRSSEICRRVTAIVETRCWLHNNRATLKESLIDAAWPGMVAEDSNLTVQIAAARLPLRRASRQPRPASGTA